MKSKSGILQDMTKSFAENDIWVEQNERGINPPCLNEKYLERVGFTSVPNPIYINGIQWLFQVSEDYVDSEGGKVINRDGTWFDAIGTLDFEKTGKMSVNTLCRGNYVCKSVDTVESLEILFLGLRGVDIYSTVKLSKDIDSYIKDRADGYRMNYQDTKKEFIRYGESKRFYQIIENNFIHKLNH